MLTTILFAFLFSFLSVLVAGVMIGMWLIYRKFTQSVECYNMLENIIVKIHDNKDKIN